MAFGYLNEKQASIVKRYVEGKEVTDLGAGDFSLAEQLVSLGAQRVIAIEKETPTRRVLPKIEIKTTYFHCYKGSPDIAWCSWPCNWQDTGLVAVLRRSKTIVYLGKNTDGTSCGGPELWHMLRHREVLVYSPSRMNTLIVYGGLAPEPRELYGEERAGLNLDEWHCYEEIEKLSSP